MDELFKLEEPEDKEREKLEERLEKLRERCERIRVKAAHYEQAYYDIMTCSEDEVDFKVFRVMAHKLKSVLGHAADKIKKAILDRTYKYCTDTVTSVAFKYKEMIDNINHEPADEKELKFAKEFN